MWAAASLDAALRNSCVVSFLPTALALAVSLPTAYALAKFPFHGKGLYALFRLLIRVLSTGRTAPSSPVCSPVIENGDTESHLRFLRRQMGIVARRAHPNGQSQSTQASTKKKKNGMLRYAAE